MTIGIIPARMNSSRFPGKPLAKIAGIPMVGHCYFRSRLSLELDELYIATCDTQISEYANSIGAPCVMTSDAHQRATERVAEALEKVELRTGQRHEIVVLIQGDEPMIRPEMINSLVSELKKDKRVVVANGYTCIRTEREFRDPNEIKVVIDENSDAIYFSREPIPSAAKYEGEVTKWKQVCIIPFRREFLMEFYHQTETPLEIYESIDMLRVIERGQKVRMVKLLEHSVSVDTPDDLERVRGLMKDDDLIKAYD